MLTAQEIFDKAYLGVIEQGAPGTNKNGLCMYYSHDTNNRCGIGQILSVQEIKNLQKKGFLGGAVDAIPEGVLVDHPELQKAYKALALRIQASHDASAQRPEIFLELFKEDMKEVAEQFALKVPEVPTP